MGRLLLPGLVRVVGGFGTVVVVRELDDGDDRIDDVGDAGTRDISISPERLEPMSSPHPQSSVSFESPGSFVDLSFVQQVNKKHSCEANQQQKGSTILDLPYFFPNLQSMISAFLLLWSKHGGRGGGPRMFAGVASRGTSTTTFATHAAHGKDNHNGNDTNHFGRSKG